MVAELRYFRFHYPQIYRCLRQEGATTDSEPKPGLFESPKGNPTQAQCGYQPLNSTWDLKKKGKRIVKKFQKNSVLLQQIMRCLVILALLTVNAMIWNGLPSMENIKMPAVSCSGK